MKFDAALPALNLTDVPAVARAAEEAGFDALWTSETQHDPFLPCTLIAEHTQKLKFGTAIAVSFARSPATLAYTAWDLAAQSNGRFILGLGTQVKAHIERRFGMPWPDSVVDKLREQIQGIRAFWDAWQHATKLNFRGQYYKLTLMSPFFQPPPLPGTLMAQGVAGLGSGIPIYIAGVNTGLAKLAGELCEGFHAHPFNSPAYLREVILPSIREGEARSKREPGSTAISVTAFVATSAEETESARAQVSFYASTPSYRSVMDFHGWGATAERLSAHAARGEWKEMPALISDEMLGQFCLVTEEGALSAGLQKRYQGIADRLALYSAFEPGRGSRDWRKLAGEFRS
jgi:probable F420-dependent oxidoreductase